jgi:hypothetical protein
MAQALQWATSVFSANPDPLVSPPVIITLCTLVLALSIFDIALDFLSEEEDV